MRGKSPAQIRLGLAEGHWLLGEHEQALACLARLLEAEPEVPAALGLLEQLLGEADAAGAAPEIRERLEGLKREFAPGSTPAPTRGSRFTLATPTMAELLEQQGHVERALEVAEGVLRRNPADARALAVRRRLRPAARDDEELIALLERWLDYFRQRRERGAHP